MDFHRMRNNLNNAIASDSEDEIDSDNEDNNWKRRKEQEPTSTNNGIEIPHSSAFIESASKFSEAKKNSGQSGGFNKLNVWSNVLQQRMLVENLQSVGVNKSYHNNDRGSESYQYPGWDRPGNNRSNAPIWKMDSQEIHSRLGRKRTRKNKSSTLPKNKRSFQVTAENTNEEVTKAIAVVLREPKEDLIAKTVSVLGKEKALEILKMTEDIEENNGMMTADNSRRRTPGGVFLLLVRKDRHVTNDQLKSIFEEDRQKEAHNRKDIAKAIRRKKAVQKIETQLDDVKILPTRAEVVMAETPKKSLASETMDVELNVEKEPGELTDSDNEDDK